MSIRNWFVGVVGVVLFGGATSSMAGLVVGPAIDVPGLPHPSLNAESLTYISPDATFMLTTYGPTPGYIGARTWNGGTGQWSDREQVLSAGSASAYLSPDGNTMYYGSAQPIGGPSEIYRSTWDGSAWVNRELVANVGSPGSDQGPTFNGQQLFWDGNSHQDIFVADYNAGNGLFSNSRSVDSINTSSEEQDPWISSDGQQLIFTSNRPGGYGGRDLYSATWDADTLGWIGITNFGANVNTADDEGWGRLAEDAGILFFGRWAPGSINMMQANVVPEPSSLIVWSLIGLSVAGIGYWRRSRAA